MADNNFLSDFKTYKGINQDNSDTDSLMNQTLNAIQDALAKEYWVYLDSTDNTFVFSGNNQNKLFLPTYYFTLNSIKINGTSIDLSKFYIEGNIIHYINNTFPKGYGNIEVSVKLGFSSKDDIPKSLLEAFLIYADNVYESALTNNNSNTVITDPVGGHMTMVNKLPGSFYRLLNPHVVVNM